MLAARTGAAGRTVADPFRCTSFETLLRLLIAPRGTPSPALPFCTTRRRGTPEEMPGWPTVTVAVPVVGATGGLKRCGALVTRGTLYQPPPNPPGAHIQP